LSEVSFDECHRSHSSQSSAFWRVLLKINAGRRFLFSISSYRSSSMFSLTLHVVKLPSLLKLPTSRSLCMARYYYTCQIEAKPLHRYHAGGCHPIHLGDLMENRYEVVTNWVWKRTLQYGPLKTACWDKLIHCKSRKFTASQGKSKCCYESQYFWK